MTVLLVDAKNALYRQGWAFKNLAAADGTRTGAVYGILKYLLRLKRRFRDGQFIMVWDGPGKSWRYNLYPGYKANRKKDTVIPENVQAILAQIETVKEITSELGVPNICIPSLEADDVIALIARKVVKQRRTIVCSSDRDFLQLMPLGVKIIHDAEAPVNEAWVKMKFRCEPEKILQVRAIAGDSSDSIPGVLEGVGVARAAMLVQCGADAQLSQFGDHGPEICNSIHILAPCWDNVHRNYRLMKLMDKADVRREYDMKMLTIVKSEINNAIKGMGNHATLSSYRKVVAVFAGLDLMEAMADRRELSRLQVVE